MLISKSFDKQFQSELDKVIKLNDISNNVNDKQLISQINSILPSLNKDAVSLVKNILDKNVDKSTFDQISDLRTLSKQLYPVTDNYKDVQYFNSPEFKVYQLLSDIYSFYNYQPTPTNQLINNANKFKESITKKLQQEYNKLLPIVSKFSKKPFYISSIISDNNIIDQELPNNFQVTLFNDDGKAFLSYYYDTENNNKLIVSEETDIYDDFSDEEIPQQDKIAYMNILNMIRTGKAPSDKPIKLFRYMSHTEYNNWLAGNVIPIGKFFTNSKSNQYAPDFTNIDHSNSDVFEFSIPESSVAQTQQNVFQLLTPSKLSGHSIVPIPTSMTESLINIYYQVL